MSRLSCNPVRAKVALGALLLLVVTSAAACDEDSKTAPARCADPALPIFDIQAAGAPADDNAQYPCVTAVGHAISQKFDATPTAGTSTGGTATAGSAGKGGHGGTAAASAGAGGAP